MNKLHIAIFCFALAFLMSCSDNLFGSSNSGNCGKDIKCLRLEAENAFRSGEYKKAYDTYSKIASIDSTASVGYFGMAKAGLWMKRINPFDVFRFVKLEDDQIPFIKDSIRVQNRYLQGMKAAAVPLSILERRDSLTALYELHLKNELSQRERLSAFRDTFCLSSPTGPCKGFPLSDREFKYNSYSGGLLISTMAKTLLEIFDTNNDGCITKKEIELIRIGELANDYPIDTADTKKWNDWGCKRNEKGYFTHDLSLRLAKDSDGNLSIDIDLILEDLNKELESFFISQITDPNTPLPLDIEDINSTISGFTGSMDEVISILGSFGGGDDDFSSADTTEWQKEVENYKDYATFHKVSTYIDEDGDGCVDEELLNKLDNDGDGIKSENARLASLEPAGPENPFWGKTSTNHSMHGNPESRIDIENGRNLPIKQKAPVIICNTKDCSRVTELWGDGNSDSVTVIKFILDSDYWTTDNLELKLQIARDTVCPPEYNLDYRKNNIGGCWKNYDDDKFVNYWLKRKLARDQNRIDSSCKACKSTQECLRR